MWLSKILNLFKRYFSNKKWTKAYFKAYMYSIHTHILVAGWNTLEYPWIPLNAFAKWCKNAGCTIIVQPAFLHHFAKAFKGVKSLVFFYEGLRLFAERCEREALFGISMHFQSVYTLASNTLYKLWLLFEIQPPLAGKIWSYIQGSTLGST